MVKSQNRIEFKCCAMLNTRRSGDVTRGFPATSATPATLATPATPHKHAF